jgi:hypothetical protein
VRLCASSCSLDGALFILTCFFKEKVDKNLSKSFSVVAMKLAITPKQIKACNQKNIHIITQTFHILKGKTK